MNVEAGTLAKPAADVLMFVGAPVVGNEAHVQMLGHLAADFVEKAQPLHARMSLLEPTDECAAQVIKGGEESDRFVPDTVVGLRAGAFAGTPSPDRKQWDRAAARDNDVLAAQITAMLCAPSPGPTPCRTRCSGPAGRYLLQAPSPITPNDRPATGVNE
ncbi:MAG: hypothetical protein WAW54_16205 [Parvibaculum sedimenti]